MLDEVFLEAEERKQTSEICYITKHPLPLQVFIGVLAWFHLYNGVYLMGPGSLVHCDGSEVLPCRLDQTAQPINTLKLHQ